MRNGVGEIEPQHANISQTKSRRLIAGTTYAPGKPFDPEKIPRRILRRHSDKESAVATARIDLDRRSAAKKLHEIELREN